MSGTKTPQRIDTPGNGDVQYYEYSPRVIGGLIVAYVLALAVAAIPASELLATLAGLTFLVVTVVAFVLDRRAVLTLRGRIGQWQPSGCLTVGLVVLFFPLFLFWMIPYLIVAALDTRAADARRALERQRRIAELEGRLGLLPEPAGTCPACGKPLQAGAEYCAYCGGSVTMPLRLCPTCGTRTFPDASWCPSCGRPLPPIAAG